MTFNSLSRDHGFKVTYQVGQGISVGLSTPSLGITRSCDPACSVATPRCFQLPLSGSRDHLNLRGFLEKFREEVSFNSLSRDHPVIPFLRDHTPRRGLSTPSLGITCSACRRRSRRCSAVLSTPSLGITARQQGERDMIVNVNFQLPLSGSPSPIPGFSGSPRLPAAAPLRTNVFFGHYLKI